MIRDGFLSDHSVDDLAERLGIGHRHLARLFQIHAGTTPLAVAKTCRVQQAKRLLDDPDMSITEIAFAAGFSSVRRFNAVFLETYGRPPSSVRRRNRRLRGSRGTDHRCDACRKAPDEPADCDRHGG